MDTFEFDYQYHFASVIPTPTSNYPISFSGGTLVEINGNDDGSIPVAGNVGVNFDSGVGMTGTLLGVTSNGDPLLELFLGPGPFDGPFYYILSNDPDLASQPVGPVGGPLCFLAGTMIATAKGHVRVEDLMIDDQVVTEEGDLVSVKWVGRQTIATRFGLAAHLLPVRIGTGALGDGLPHRDLIVTADHALLIEDVLINASALVNGTSIAYVTPSDLGERYAVYHIETENHEVILAEGAPAETFIDYAASRAFDNYPDYVARYGDEPTLEESRYPRVPSARMLPQAVRHRLAQDHVA